MTATGRAPLPASRLVAGLAIAALAWTCATVATGGFSLAIAGVRLSSRAPGRPALVAAALALAYLLVAGHAGLRRDLRLVQPLFQARPLAILIAISLVAIALGWNAWTAGGSDAYAYVTAADLLRRGDMRVAVPLATTAPWPHALSTLIPYGFSAATDGAAIVPVTAPGFSALMAMLQVVAGHCAGFWVAPACAGLLAWATYQVGRRVDSPWTGVAAAWIVATSPTVLAMAKSVMSDIPAAAFWAIAVAGLLGSTRTTVVGAGLATGMAILIRPNLAPIAVVLLAWCAWRDHRDPPSGARRTWAFGAAALPGPLLVAMFNASVYGSPLSSGYGALGPLFAFAHIPVNLGRYAGWLLQTEGALAMAGLIALVLPWRALWPADRVIGSRALLAGVALAVWGAYLAYTPFEAWWFLRFLLPAWMPMAVGTVLVIRRLAAIVPRGRSILATVIVLGLGGRGLIQTQALGVFPPGEGERRYASVALLVRELTPPSAVIITGQHAGAVRYYGGRLTLRFDQLDPAWLDRAVAWLDAAGRPAFVLLEDWERPLYEERFAAGNALGRLTLAPVLAWRAHRIPGTVFLFDPRHPDGPTHRPAPAPDPRPRCVRPAPEGLY